MTGLQTAARNVSADPAEDFDAVIIGAGVSQERGLTRIEATSAGVADWTDHVKALGAGLLMNEIDTWMTGVNRNVEGKQTRKIMRYSGGHPAFRTHCDAVVADSYRKLAPA